MPIIDNTILDAVLDADEESHGTDQLALHAKLQQRRRERAHVKAKAAQPALASKLPADAFKTIHDFLRAPLTAEDADWGVGALDHLLLTVQDTADAQNLEDMIFALIRVFRKVWSRNVTHLGPIEGAEKALAAYAALRENGNLPGILTVANSTLAPMDTTRAQSVVCSNDVRHSASPQDSVTASLHDFEMHPKKN